MEEEVPQFKIGDRLSAWNIYTYTTAFYQVVGVTKGGNLRVQQLQEETQNLGAGPLQSSESVRPLDSFTGSIKVARWSKEYRGFCVLDEHKVKQILRLYDPNSNYQNDRYY